MIQTRVLCGKCGSGAVRKNGSRNGKPKYQCTACRYQALFEPAAIGQAGQYAQVEKLLLERVSQRAIVRLTGVSRPTIVRLAKKRANHAALAAQAESSAGAGVG